MIYLAAMGGCRNRSRRVFLRFQIRSRFVPDQVQIRSRQGYKVLIFQKSGWHVRTCHPDSGLELSIWTSKLKVLSRRPSLHSDKARTTCQRCRSIPSKQPSWPLLPSSHPLAVVPGWLRDASVVSLTTKTRFSSGSSRKCCRMESMHGRRWLPLTTWSQAKLLFGTRTI